MYKVKVRSLTGWVTHSSFSSYGCAVDQADLVHGKIQDPSGQWDQLAWSKACTENRFEGSYAAWQLLEDSDRDQFLPVQFRGFRFATDAEHGLIHTKTFSEACSVLENQVQPDGWGWVEDHDQTRFELGTNQ